VHKKTRRQFMLAAGSQKLLWFIASR